jgi:hypothetical protein
MELKDMLPFAIILVVLGFVFSIGQNIMGSQAENACDSAGSRYVTNLTKPLGLTALNPATDSMEGCCKTFGVSGGNNCSVWETTSYAVNSTANAMLGLNESVTWLPTIAQVVVAAIIIGILISALYVKFKQ